MSNLKSKRKIFTSIPITPKTKERMNQFGRMSYDSIVNVLLDKWEEDEKC